MISRALLPLLADSYGRPTSEAEAEEMLKGGVMMMLDSQRYAKSPVDKNFNKELWDKANGAHLTRDLLRAYMGQSGYLFSNDNQSKKLAKAALRKKKAEKNEPEKASYTQVLSKTTDKEEHMKVITKSIDEFKEKSSTTHKNLIDAATNWREETLKRNLAFLDEKVLIHPKVIEYAQAKIQYDGEQSSKVLLYLALQSSSKSALRVLGFRSDATTDSPFDMGYLKKLLEPKKDSAMATVTETESQGGTPTSSVSGEEEEDNGDDDNTGEDNTPTPEGRADSDKANEARSPLPKPP